MRKLTLVSLIAVTPLASACAVMKHVYVAPGISALPYRDQPLSNVEDLRAGITVDPLPTWAFGIAYIYTGRPDSATYIEPKCGCRPGIVTTSTGFDVQQRWAPTQAVHPFASLSVGTAESKDIYASRTSQYGLASDSTRSSSFATLAGGGELNVMPWLHLTVAAGYRAVSLRSSRNGNDNPSGFTLTSLLVLGQPYRDP